MLELPPEKELLIRIPIERRREGKETRTKGKWGKEGEWEGGRNEGRDCDEKETLIALIWKIQLKNKGMKLASDIDVIITNTKENEPRESDKFAAL